MKIRTWAGLLIIAIIAAVGVFSLGASNFSILKPVQGSDKKLFFSPQGLGVDRVESSTVFEVSSEENRYSEESRYYKITAEFDPIERTIKGNSRLILYNDQPEAFRVLYFHLYPNAFADSQFTPAPSEAYLAGFSQGKIEIEEVLVNGSPVRTEINRTVLKVNLYHPILFQEKATIDIKFTVTIPQVAYRFGCYNGVTMLGNWYPILAVRDFRGWNLGPYTSLGDPFYSQVSNYEVSLLLPAEQVVASTGWMESRENYQDGKKKLLLKATGVRDFALAISSKYRMAIDRIDDIIVRSYYLAENEKGGRLALEAARKSLWYYNQVYCKYPYSYFSVVEVPMVGFKGMEYPMLVFISSDNYTYKHSLRVWEPLVAHEVAHQWWYGLVGNDQYHEAWIDEGMAVWSTEMYLQHQYGFDYKKLENDEKSELFSPILKSLKEYQDRDEYYDKVYTGASLLWKALIKELGREKVQEIWRYLIKEYKYKEITTEDVLEAVNKFAEDNFEDFFRMRLGDFFISRP